MKTSLVIGVVLCGLASSSCSVKKFAIKQIGDSLNSGPSVFETDDDIELVGEALPFSLKFVETLLAEVPNDPDLLITAARGFVLYTYGYVDFEAKQVLETDLDEGRRLRARARRLYARGMGYGLRGLDRFYPGFENQLKTDPVAAVALLKPSKAKRDVPFLYWTAAALGLAISVSKDDAAMLSRIPEVEAMLNRAIELDPGWDNGALPAFAVTFEGAKPTGGSRQAIDQSFRTAERMSAGKDAGLYVSYAENVAIPEQDAVLFRDMLGKALAVDADSVPARRLANLIAQRRAQWLLGRIEDLFLIVPETTETTGAQ
ncbi:MAG: TRAP transporter TatT component family protein [Acidobacteria bacterium]|nr:TRAP transporter TatT component family protein [Acidobacteriota bacterium]MDA1233256.1 TRAP transporter TatT component family protein [Acidobacteriota bacterium]